MIGPLTLHDAIKEQLYRIAFTAIGAFGDFGDFDFVSFVCPCLIDGPRLREQVDAYHYLDSVAEVRTAEAIGRVERLFCIDESEGEHEDGQT